MSFPPQNFMHQPCCYYWVQEIEKYGSGVSSSGLEVAIEYSQTHSEAVFDLKSRFFVCLFVCLLFLFPFVGKKFGQKYVGMKVF